MWYKVKGQSYSSEHKVGTAASDPNDVQIKQLPKAIQTALTTPAADADAERHSQCWQYGCDRSWRPGEPFSAITVSIYRHLENYLQYKVLLRELCCSLNYNKWELQTCVSLFGQQRKRWTLSGTVWEDSWPVLVFWTMEQTYRRQFKLVYKLCTSFCQVQYLLFFYLHLFLFFLNRLLRDQCVSSYMFTRQFAASSGLFAAGCGAGGRVQWRTVMWSSALEEDYRPCFSVGLSVRALKHAQQFALLKIERAIRTAFRLQRSQIVDRVVTLEGWEIHYQYPHSSLIPPHDFEAHESSKTTPRPNLLHPNLIFGCAKVLFYQILLYRYFHFFKLMWIVLQWKDSCAVSQIKIGSTFGALVP